MNFKDLNKIELKHKFPKEIKDSVACFALVDSRVSNEAPDLVSCNTNGYLYEIKDRKILRCLNLEDKPSSVSCHYLIEQNKPIVFYVVFTQSNKLLIIRAVNKRLKVVEEFSDIESFQVYDFKLLGFPQIKIHFCDKSESLIFQFPVATNPEKKFSAADNFNSDSLSEELEDLKKCIDVLNEEYNHLKRICFSDDTPSDVSKITLGSPNFSSPVSNSTVNVLEVQGKWFKVFGSTLILGIGIKNISNEVIDGLDVIINHDQIKDYAISIFQLFSGIDQYFFTNHHFDGFLKPEQKLCVVCSFEIPEFSAESDLTVECHVTSKNLKTIYLKEGFKVNVCDIALQSGLDLEKEFSLETFLAVMAIKTETCLIIEAEHVEDDLMPSLLENNLGFKLIKPLKDKLFYCTSTYLREVFVVLRHISKKPAVWKMAVYACQEQQIYFLVNALYDLLPDNSAILCDEDSD